MACSTTQLCRRPSAIVSVTAGRQCLVAFASKYTRSGGCAEELEQGVRSARLLGIAEHGGGYCRSNLQLFRQRSHDVYSGHRCEFGDLLHRELRFARGHQLADKPAIAYARFLPHLVANAEL